MVMTEFWYVAVGISWWCCCYACCILLSRTILVKGNYDFKTRVCYLDAIAFVVMCHQSYNKVGSSHTDSLYLLPSDVLGKLFAQCCTIRARLSFCIIWKRSSHPWNEEFIFYVEHFHSILQLWNNCFPCTPGYTDRIVFVVECWVWSIEGGWEYNDYM